MRISRDGFHRFFCRMYLLFEKVFVKILTHVEHARSTKLAYRVRPPRWHVSWNETVSPCLHPYAVFSTPCKQEGRAKLHRQPYTAQGVHRPSSLLPCIVSCRCHAHRTRGSRGWWLTVLQVGLLPSSRREESHLHTISSVGVATMWMTIAEKRLQDVELGAWRRSCVHVQGSCDAHVDVLEGCVELPNPTWSRNWIRRRGRTRNSPCGWRIQTWRGTQPSTNA